MLNKMKVLIDISSNRVESYLSTVGYYVFKVYKNDTNSETSCSGETVEKAFNEITYKIKCELEKEMNSKIEERSKLNGEIKLLNEQIDILKEK